MRALLRILPFAAGIAPALAAPAPEPAPPRAVTPHAVSAADYPVESIPLLEEGIARIGYVVRTDGAVGDLKVERSSGFPRLDEAALRIVATWRFAPAVQGGRAIAWQQYAEVAFQLRPGPGPGPGSRP